MKRMLLEGPAAEPLLLAEAKAHLRLDGDAEDALIGALIAAARVAIESDIRRVLIAQRWRALFEDWPGEGILLPVAPALSVEEVRAFDADDVASVLDPSAYAFEVVDGRVTLIDGAGGAARYEIDFTAGYGSSGVDVPQPLRLAMRLLVAHWFENRSAVVLGDGASAMPLGYRELITPFRRLALC
jgi:uncharacterized phiE125 gp8 family phage protein